MSDTDVEATPTLTEVLVKNALYSHHGNLMIAVDDTTLRHLMDDETVEVRPAQVTLTHEPGSEDWVNRMARVHRSLTNSLAHRTQALQEKNLHLEGLGQALLEEATRRKWCEEYDEFAKEWDLPTRNKEYEVFMTVRVTAPSPEEALDIVRGEVGLDSYHTEGVDTDPEFTVSER